MSRLRLIPLILLLLALGCVMPCFLAANYCDEARPAVARCAELAREARWDEAETCAEAIRTGFEAFRQRAGGFVSDSVLDSAESTLYELTVCVQLRDNAGLAAASLRAEAALTALQRSQLPSWDRLW